MATKILLSQELGDNIFTRNTISTFFEKINNRKEAEITFDFENVEFISRSCVDEYLKQKKKATKKIVEVNVSREVCSMFNVVRVQYEKAGFEVSFDFCSGSDELVVA